MKLLLTENTVNGSEYSAVITDETENACKVKCRRKDLETGKGYKKEDWYPKSQVEITDDGIDIPDWMVDKKKLYTECLEGFVAEKPVAAIIVAVTDSKKASSYELKDELKKEGAVFGKYSDGIDSKFWVFECETLDNAKEKMAIIWDLKLNEGLYFTNDRRSLLPESDMTAEQESIAKELYFYRKELKC